MMILFKINTILVVLIVNKFVGINSMSMSMSMRANENPRRIQTIHTQSSCNVKLTRRQALHNYAATFVIPSYVLTSCVSTPDVASATISDVKYVEGTRGLKYVITKEGEIDARKPQRAQRIKVSYTLYLNGFEEDGGSKIDSSKGLLGDKPLGLLVGTGAVIKGWDLALMDMKEGEARRLLIPPSLAYGDRGAGGRIPGGATLYFEVDVKEIGETPDLTAEQEKWLDDHPL